MNNFSGLDAATLATLLASLPADQLAGILAAKGLKVSPAKGGKTATAVDPLEFVGTLAMVAAVGSLSEGIRALPAELRAEFIRSERRALRAESAEPGEDSGEDSDDAPENPDAVRLFVQAKVGDIWCLELDSSGAAIRYAVTDRPEAKRGRGSEGVTLTLTPEKGGASVTLNNRKDASRVSFAKRVVRAAK